jgi:hypothetical protein
MVWKQDLAKLKQELQEESGAPDSPKVSPQRKAEKPTEPRPLEEEDALFLQSMGKRPAPPSLQVNPLREKPELPSKQEPVGDSESFFQAMSDLKGIKTTEGQGGPPPLPVPFPEAVPVPPVGSQVDQTALKAPLLSQLLAASEETRPFDTPPPPAAALKPKGPVLIQLAAGMAIEVDGLLDVRNHTLSDARDRLKERIEDALLLGWRSMHVILGPSEALKQGFLAFLTTPSARAVQRYAQAPVPMGGSQAWILYLGTPP